MFFHPLQDNIVDDKFLAWVTMWILVLLERQLWNTLSAYLLSLHREIQALIVFLLRLLTCPGNSTGKAGA